MTRNPKTRWTLPAALLLLLVLPRCQRAEAPLPPETEALPTVEDAPRQESPPASPGGPVGEAPPPVLPPKPVPETDPRAGLCSSGDWCWLHPETPTDAYRDVWALDDEHVLALCSPSRVLHWRNGDWKFLPSDTGNLLYSVWGSSPTEAWAVGEGGTIVHWDGTRWKRAREGGPTLYTVFGTGPRQVWAGGEGGTLLHWDGTRWSNVPSGTPRAIRHLWASGPQDLWASVWNSDELGGALRHWNGQEWSTSLGGAELYITSIWGFGPEDVWITGWDGLLAHWAGLEWQLAPDSDPTGPSDRFLTVRGRGPSDLWVTGTDLWHFNGQRLSTRLHDPQAVGMFTSIAVGSKGPLLAVGLLGTLVEYGEGGTWKVLTSHRPRMLADLLDVWAPDAKTPWVVDDHRVARWNGASWTRVDAGLPVEMGVFVLSGTSPSDVWAGGRMADQLAMAHFDGTSWRHTLLPQQETPTSLWALHADEVWATGYGGSVLRWDGQSWRTVLQLKGYALGVHGSSKDNIWVVGSGGALFQWNGRDWVNHTLTSPSPTLTAVWASGPEDVWATADDGKVWHWDGHDVRPWETGARAPLRSLYGRAADDVWAVGEQGNIVHWDGRAWTRVPSGTTQWLRNVWGAEGNVFAVGAMQTVLERREAPGTPAP